MSGQERKEHPRWHRAYRFRLILYSTRHVLVRSTPELPVGDFELNSSELTLPVLQLETLGVDQKHAANNRDLLGTRGKQSRFPWLRASLRGQHASTAMMQAGRAITGNLIVDLVIGKL